ncbi:MAG: presqualene diphosphate synthase HpnD [Chthoniobacterales bacterium]
MDAEKITRQSKSNLALAFVSLGKEQRQDITTFYAFCRVIDDIADSTVASTADKAAGLAAWREWLSAPVSGEDSLARNVRALVAKYHLTPAMLEEIIAGVEMDLTQSRYATWEALRLYCYRVASAVGLVSIEIFGYKNPRCQEYAIDLGLALQTTNIIRDVGKDMRLGRVYLPQDEMARFGYSEEDLVNDKRDDAFHALMEFQAERSRGFYRSAAALLPPEDRRSMIAAEIMASVYGKLLARMNADGFRVFEKEYRLSRLAKSLLVLRRLAGA